MYDVVGGILSRQTHRKGTHSRGIEGEYSEAKGVKLGALLHVCL